MVGDASQTIYSFAGATRATCSASRTLPDATVVRLVRDYRSTPQVVALANALLDRADGPGGEGPGASSSRSARRARARRSRAPDEPAEAREVAGRIARADRRAAYGCREIAVLYRINAQSEEYEQALTDAGVPYMVRGGERFFERPEVREAIAGCCAARPAAASRQPGRPAGERRARGPCRRRPNG